MPALAQLGIQSIGSDRDYQVTLYDSSGNLVTTFTGTEPLTAVLWAGETQPILQTLTASWISAAAGTIKLTVPATAIAALTRGRYRVKLTISASGRNYDAGEFVLELIEQAASDTAPSVYCTLQDLIDEAPWIQDLADDLGDLAAFAKHRKQARDWMDSLILKSYRGGGASAIGPAGYWMNTWANRGSLLRSIFLTQLLDGGPAAAGPPAVNGLIVGPTATNKGNPKILRACALYAIHKICRAQIGAAGKSDLVKLGGMYYLDAQAEAGSCVAEVDTNQDGWGEIAIPLSYTNTRYS